MLRRIVVGYDFSESADDALNWVADIARTMGAHISVAHVVDASDEHDPRVEEVRVNLAHAVQDLNADVSTHAIVGRPVAATLIAFADSTDADAIVVAMKGASVRRWILGSVADEVLHKSFCPVIAWRSDET